VCLSTQLLHIAFYPEFIPSRSLTRLYPACNLFKRYLIAEVLCHNPCMHSVCFLSVVPANVSPTIFQAERCKAWPRWINCRSSGIPDSTLETWISKACGNWHNDTRSRWWFLNAWQLNGTAGPLSDANYRLPFIVEIWPNLTRLGQLIFCQFGTGINGASVTRNHATVAVIHTIWWALPPSCVCHYLNFNDSNYLVS